MSYLKAGAKPACCKLVQKIKQITKTANQSAVLILVTLAKNVNIYLSLKHYLLLWGNVIFFAKINK
ncbi:hypothetical protein CDQ84_03260 [Clostridium thermosuccinogenes]|uniref:Uncharacterized protein n=1 Tax=Clostridium thermosuccinogenes TaxID=84032 RepID=A0A2K2FK05_9CLOT|nr:hypothetical protein CDO33_01120 [Pseudoclostridium thermosuccinogenes]PNT99111.1 hypothetical protein CDQ85_03260 [Pseudoclostridium thermosuccinogenes]PNU00915.1 hypothetical protein CDQ84_03260 [Pseudoclostridium thermosuccinogenes]